MELLLPSNVSSTKIIMLKSIRSKKASFLPLLLALLYYSVGVHAVHPLLHSHVLGDEHATSQYQDSIGYGKYVSLYENSYSHSGVCAICEILAANPVFDFQEHKLVLHKKTFQIIIPAFLENLCAVKLSDLFIRGPPVNPLYTIS